VHLLYAMHSIFNNKTIVDNKNSRLHSGQLLPLVRHFMYVYAIFALFISGHCAQAWRHPQNWKYKNIWEELRRKGPTGYNGTPQLHPQNCPFPFDDNHPHIIHPFLDRPHSPPLTASGSNQPFCHSTLSGHTDRPTDRQTGRWDRRQVYTISAYARYIDRERRAKNVIKRFCIYGEYRDVAVCSSLVITSRNEAESRHISHRLVIAIQQQSGGHHMHLFYLVKHKLA